MTPPNITPLNEELDSVIDKIFAWAEDDGDFMMDCRAEAKQELTNLIQTLEQKAKDERVKKAKSFCGCPMCYFHVSAYAIPPNNTTTRSKE